MIDLYLVNTIINAIWYIFTILFLLYRFTSFFSYIYNFVRFSGKIISGGIYVCDYIYGSIRRPRYQYSDIESQNGLLEIQPPTMYQRAKSYINKTYNKFFGKIPDFVFNNQNRNNVNTNIKDLNNNFKQMERDMFERHINDLCESEISGSDLHEKKSSLNNSFIDQQMFNSNKNSKSDCLYCNESYELENLRRDFGTSTEELNESNYFSYRSKNSMAQSNSLDNSLPFNTLYPPPSRFSNDSNNSNNLNNSNSNLYQSINLENSVELQNLIDSTKRKISNNSINQKIKVCKFTENELTENELTENELNSEYFDTKSGDSENSENSDESENEQLLPNPYL